jgi:peptide/nickel transport system substrate-binding protein
VDYVDPGQTYYSFGYMIHYAVNRGPVLLWSGDHEKPRPDIADGEPQISSDQKTITVKLKKGIRFSPPVNREITSKDIKYGFERAFSTHVPSPTPPVYFADIVGAPSKPGAIKDIPGIETPDDSTIVFKLKGPSAALVSQALAMPISRRCPRSTPRSSTPRRRRPTTSTSSSPARTCTRTTASGKLVGRTPGKSIELVRNPNWDPKTDYARPTWTRSRSRRATTTRCPRRAGSSTGQSLVPGRRHHAGAGHQAGALAATRTRSRSSRAAATASSR